MYEWIKLKNIQYNLAKLINNKQNQLAKKSWNHVLTTSLTVWLGFYIRNALWNFNVHVKNEWWLIWWRYLIQMEWLVYFHWMIMTLSLNQSSWKIYSLPGNLVHCLSGHYLQQNQCCTESYCCSQWECCPCFLSSVHLATSKSSCQVGLQLDLYCVKV